MQEILRTDNFRNYVEGHDFKLEIWPLQETRGGRSMLGYRLFIDGAMLFLGEDFGCSPLHAIDSDECVFTLMGFLCMTKGSVDADYFLGYNDRQIHFRDQYAEDLMRGVELQLRPAAIAAGIDFDEDLSEDA